MYKFYLDKQECYNPDRDKPFSYTNIKEVSDMTLSNNLLMIDEDSGRMYYSFLHDTKPRLEKSKKSHYKEMMDMFFPIVKEDTAKVSYCEVDYNQLKQFLTVKRYGYTSKDRKEWVKLLKSIDIKLEKV